MLSYNKWVVKNLGDNRYSISYIFHPNFSPAQRWPTRAAKYVRIFRFYNAYNIFIIIIL